MVQGSSLIRLRSVTGDDPDTVERSVLVRAAAGGASHRFAHECSDRNLEHSFGDRIDHRVRDGVSGRAPTTSSATPMRAGSPTCASTTWSPTRHG